MKNLSVDICRKIREARREAGISQSELATEMGCKQSALSMFECGDGTKLNDEVIGKLAKKFNIEIVEAERTPIAQPARQVQVAKLPHSGFCPNPNCPSHQRYQVEGRQLLSPNREMQDPVGGRYCAVCGEILERKCPNCGSDVNNGAICSWCGNQYVV